MDDLWTMIILGLLAAVSNWITTRKQAREAEESPLEEAWNPTSGDQPTSPSEWEEQMRRLIGQPVPKKTSQSPSAPLPRSSATQIEPARAQEELKKIQAKNAERMKQVASLSRKRMTGKRGRQRGLHAPHPTAVEWLAHPKTLRQAILAQTILEPPKALQGLNPPGQDF